MRNPLRFLHVYDVSREHASWCHLDLCVAADSNDFLMWRPKLCKAGDLRPSLWIWRIGLGNSNARVNGAMRTVWIKTRMAYLRDWTMDDSSLRQELLPRAIQPDFVVSIHIRSLSSNTYCILQLPESLEFSASNRCSQMHVKWVK